MTGPCQLGPTPLTASGHCSATAGRRTRRTAPPGANSRSAEPTRQPRSARVGPDRAALLQHAGRGDADPGHPPAVQREHPQHPTMIAADRVRSPFRSPDPRSPSGVRVAPPVLVGSTGTGTSSPVAGSRPSAAIMNPPTVSYGPSGSANPTRSAKSARLSRPSTTAGAPAQHRLGCRVVLVVDLADQFLDQVFEGDDAGGTAVLVHHHRQVLPFPAHLGQRGEHPLAAGQLLDLAGQLADGDVVRRRPGGAARRAGGRSRSRRRGYGRPPGTGCGSPPGPAWPPLRG